MFLKTIPSDPYLLYHPQKKAHEDGHGCSKKKMWLIPLSLFIWPIFFFSLGLHYFPDVPLHYNWDNFAYLRAAKEGRGFVGLGMGRSLFCWIGQGFEQLSLLLSLEPLFGGFWLWVVSTLFMQALILFLAGWFLARRIGPAAAHIFCALMATQPQLINLFLANWPENSALILFFASSLIVCYTRFHLRFRIASSLAITILMVLMKEITVYYVPALAILTFASIPRKKPLLLRLGIPCMWAAAAVAVPILANKYLLPWMIPGLAEAQLVVKQAHFGMISINTDWVTNNLSRIVRGVDSSPAIYALAVLGLARFIVQLIRQTITPTAVALICFAVALIVVPLMMVTTLGVYSAIPRYATAIIPGLALLGASFFIRPLPKWFDMTGPQLRIIGLTCIAIIVLMNWSFLPYCRKTGIKDAARYERMMEMRDAPMLILAFGDAWPAHYISLYGGEKQADTTWKIEWPTWSKKIKNYDLQREYILAEAAAGRRIAVSPAISKALKKPMRTIQKGLAPLRFKKDACGWWVSSPPRKPPRKRRRIDKPAKSKPLAESGKDKPFQFPVEQ